MPSKNKNTGINFKEAWSQGQDVGKSLIKKTKKSKIKGEKTKDMSKKSRPISIYKKIAASFIVLTLLLVIAVVYFSVVNVKIVIIPNKERTATSFIASVQDSSLSKEISGLTIRGVVEEVPLTVTNTFIATGKDVTGQEVTGVVNIINNSRRSQPLIKTTRLLSADNKLYRLKNTVRVEPGETIENVEVYADQSTEEMATGPTTFTIPGLSASAQELIYAESKSDITYQETGEISISSSDIAKAKQTLKDELLAKVEQISKGNQYKDYDNIISDVSENNIEYTSEVSVGDKVSEFSMIAAADAAIVGFNSSDVSRLTLLKVSENIPEDKELEDFDEDNFIYSIDRYDLDNKTADVKIEAVAQMILKGGTDIIDPNRLVGLTRAQLDDYLSSLREVAGYEIKFTPSWINKVPALSDHIKVEVVK